MNINGKNNELINNLDAIHTTELGVKRIKKNLSLSEDVIDWCRSRIKNAGNIVRKGKNWYVYADGSVITINAYSYTVITAHKAGKAKATQEEIIYKDIKEFQAEQLRDLFLSVEWSSGHYPDKLVVAMKNSGSVFSAWDNEKLIGLINVLDDGIMTAYIHYLLINPEYQGRGIGKKLVSLVTEKYKDYLRIELIAYDKETGFYKNCGFTAGEGSSPMCITSLWT